MIKIPLVALDKTLPIPSYAHRGDAGADLYARTDITLKNGGGRSLVPTGIAIALPNGYAGLVVPRSGLAVRHGVTCLNTPGLVDSGFRGELQVLLVNTDPTDEYQIQRGDRIAQLVVVEVATASFVHANVLDSSERGEGGFGHSGR